MYNTEFMHREKETVRWCIRVPNTITVYRYIRMCKVHEGQVIMRTYTENIQFMHRCNNCFFHLSAQSEMTEQDQRKGLCILHVHIIGLTR